MTYEYMIYEHMTYECMIYEYTYEYLCTSVLLSIYMHRESRSETDVDPVVKLIWKLESLKLSQFLSQI